MLCEKIKQLSAINHRLKPLQINMRRAWHRPELLRLLGCGEETLRFLDGRVLIFRASHYQHRTVKLADAADGAKLLGSYTQSGFQLQGEKRRDEGAHLTQP